MSELDVISQDFERDVWCLHGLPIDNLTADQALKKVSDCKPADIPHVLSTVNLNWIALSTRDQDFRKSIVDSDICTIDGVPILWLSKLFHSPMNEVVTGSGLIEKLYKQKTEEDKTTIYLFGGEENAGEIAANRINQHADGLEAVGWHNPGFCSVEQMNEQPHVESINAQSPDILLVALGANKGQSWIEQNKATINAKVISHLGATINFVAGSVKRAPRWMQRSGLEWSWRIMQEPKLFKRYFVDGLVVSKLAIGKLPSIVRYRKLHKKARNIGSNFALELVEMDNWQKIVIKGSYQTHNIQQIREVFKNAALKKTDVELCFANVNFVDNQFLGMMLVLIKHQKRACKMLHITGVNKSIDQIFRLNLLCKSLDSVGFRRWERLE